MKHRPTATVGTATQNAAELGDSLVLGAPVHTVTHRDDRVEVRGDSVAVTAGDLIIAVPPSLAGHLRFDPPLRGDRALLLHQLPAGTEIKAVAIYARTEGVS